LRFYVRDPIPIPNTDADVELHVDSLAVPRLGVGIGGREIACKYISFDNESEWFAWEIRYDIGGR
jgi:hypothetical protein